MLGTEIEIGKQNPKDPIANGGVDQAGKGVFYDLHWLLVISLFCK
jgi:hypothetical protein